MSAAAKTTAVTLRVEIVSADDALTGTVTAPGGATTEFSGWIGMLAAIGGVIDAAAPPA